MRLVYITCLLLATTICCIADSNAGTTQGDTKTTNQQTEGLVTSEAPIENSKSPVPSVNASVIANTINSTDTATSPDIVTSSVTTTVDTIATKTTDNSHNAEVKNITTTPKPNSSTTLSTTKASITPEKLTTTTTATSTITQSTADVSSSPATTAVPIPTKAAPSLPSPYKERHFDGLSFLGGIILATCLMAIGALSWKFYRTFNEQNYRTL